MTADEVARELGALEPEKRRIATKRIAGLRGKDAAALLVRALGDEDWRVRKEAALVAASMEPRVYVIEALTVAMHDAVNVGLRNGAVEALVGIGQDALARVIEEIARLDADGRKLAVEVLGGVPDPRGARALAPLLRDPDPNVRGAAAEALGRAGASGDEARELATESLTVVLASGEPLLVLSALEALTKLEARLPWALLAPLAKDPLLRRHALAAASESRDSEAIVALAQAVDDPSPTIARDAVALLGERLFEGDEDAILRARGALRLSPEAHARVRGWTAEEDTRVRGSALATLGLARNEEDVPLLVDALADDAVAERAELALRLFGEEAIGPVMAAGRTAHPLARGASISIVPTLSPGAQREVLAQLREALRSPQPDVLAGALKALGVAGGAEELALVVPIARHPEARVANAALSVLFAIAVREPAAASALRARLDPAGADAACGCVLIDARARADQADEAGEPDIAFLKTALARGGVLARRAALEALATIGGEAAADAASFALADEEREVVLAAVRAMGRLKRAEPLERLARGASDPVLIAAVLRALGDADPERFATAALPLVQSAHPAIASAAIEALGRVEGRAREDGLFAALDHPDPEVVLLALSEVGRAPDARALARLGMSLDHAAPGVRKLAGELLGNAGGPGAQALIRARLVRERDPAVRSALTRALMTRQDDRSHPPGGDPRLE